MFVCGVAVGFVRACLVTMIAVGEVNSLPLATIGLGNPPILAQKLWLALASVFVWGSEAPSLLVGNFWGLWIAGFAKYSPDLWGLSCRVSACKGVTRRGSSPPESCMYRKCLRRKRRAWLVADQLLGNSVGAIESVVRDILAFSHKCSGDLGRFGVFLLGTTRPFRGVCPCVSALWLRIVTWLILPVVICLSQRLSHACLSISNYTVKLRMAH
jgi:hypothetical protein